MKKKPVPPQVRHAQHETLVRAGRGPHPGELWCVKCSKHIQWITQQQMATLQK